jgi:hypothetical protein
MEPQKYAPCKHCGALVPQGHRHFARWCPGNADLWAGDAEQKLYRNLELVGSALMVTLTAPGIDGGLPWDLEACCHLGVHKHSGKLGCRVLPAAAELFNERCRSWWSDLWDAVAVGVNREHGRRPFMVAYVWEMQQRGVWHLHLALSTEGVGNRLAAESAASAIVERAPRYGFGTQTHVDRNRAEWGSGGVASYLAGYLIGGKGEKRPLRETVLTLAPAKTVVYVSNKLSVQTGITMRALRHKRWLVHRIACLETWLRYAQIEVLYEAVREGWWNWRAYREHLLGIPLVE